MPGGGSVPLSIVAEGPTEASRFERLVPFIGVPNIIEVSEGATGIPSMLNPAVDGAPSHWILLVRSGECVGEGLASEIAASATADPRAWGYRIGVTRLYCGRPLRLSGHEPGHVRLFHRRKAKLQPDGKMKVQGTVVRLTSTFDLVLYESSEAHLEELRRSGRVESGPVRRLTKWFWHSVKHGPKALSHPARRFLWIEAGWEQND